MPRLLDQHVQLITQSNDCCLLTFSEMKNQFERAWDVMEFTRNPEEFTYLHPDGTVFAHRSPWLGFYAHLDNIPSYHQKVRMFHIHKNGHILDDTRSLFYPKNKPLFLRLINTKTKDGLDNLMKMTKDFCAFPNEQEGQVLASRYKKILGTEKQSFVFPMHIPLSSEDREENERIERAIRDINTDYLWEKKLYLENIVTSYRDGKIKLRDLSTLYRYMTQVSEVFLDQDDFNLKKLSKDMDAEGDGTIADERGFDEIIGEKSIRDVETLLTTYRVYGHFSLCCLELFLVIKGERGIDICEACKRYYEKKHRSKKYCSARCRKKGSQKRGRKYRENKRN